MFKALFTSLFFLAMIAQANAASVEHMTNVEFNRLSNACERYADQFNDQWPMASSMLNAQ